MDAGFGAGLHDGRSTVESPPGLASGRGERRHRSARRRPLRDVQSAVLQGGVLQRCEPDPSEQHHGRPSDGSSPSHAARSTDRRQRHPMALHDQGRHRRARRESRAPSGRRSPLRGDECGCVRAVGNRATSGLDLVLQPLLYRSLRPRCQGRRRGLRWLVGVVPMVTEGTTAESAWAPLSHPVFRAPWISSLVSNIGTWMQNVGAAWAMTSLSPSPLMVALVQSATSLPVFLVGLPAGAVADIVDRRRLLLVTQCWMLVAAGLLAVLTFVGLMTATTLLALTFALGVGVAMNAPTWQAITSELVPPSELTRAVTLNALPVNIGRAVGPALGGVLVAASGPALVFALNAVSFVAVLVVVYRWRREAPRALLPAERVIGATLAGIRYARHAPPLVAVLVRLGLFIVCASAFWALLPVITRRDLGLGAFGYGLLLGCLGVGAIAGAALLPRVKRRLPLDAVIGLATVVFAVVSALTAFWRFIPGLAIAMILGGVAWIAMMAGLNGSAQTAVPAWVRARALGIYHMVIQC